MKIALLNLPFDNNYGGNLQRYALMKVLQGMGHDVTHINLYNYYYLPWYKKPYSYTKRIIRKYVLGEDVPINIERIYNERKYRNEIGIKKFYERYIQHTVPCYNISDIKRECYGRFDAYVVGSDQVWRKDMTKGIGIENYFLKFTVHENVRRIAYAISVGTDRFDYTYRDKKKLSRLYQRFDAVSVRENFTLSWLQKYGWTFPEAELNLDPTFLLDVDDYIKLIIESEVQDLTSGKIFCYVLDSTKEIEQAKRYYAEKRNMEIVNVGLENTTKTSIQQWLNNIRFSELIITDSFHGVVFSIIFRRPFIFLGNKRRGNARIESLFQTLGLGDINEEVKSYEIVERNILVLKEKSLHFLKNI